MHKNRTCSLLKLSLKVSVCLQFWTLLMLHVFVVFSISLWFSLNIYLANTLSSDMCIYRRSRRLKNLSLLLFFLDCVTTLCQSLESLLWWRRCQETNLWNTCPWCTLGLGTRGPLSWLRGFSSTHCKSSTWPITALETVLLWLWWKHAGTTPLFTLCSKWLVTSSTAVHINVLYCII